VPLNKGSGYITGRCILPNLRDDGVIDLTVEYNLTHAQFNSHPTLQRQNTENLKQIFPGQELRGYSPNFNIHVSVSDLYIPLIGLHTLL
jgi:hypothetical protein